MPTSGLSPVFPGGVATGLAIACGGEERRFSNSTITVYWPVQTSPQACMSSRGRCSHTVMPPCRPKAWMNSFWSMVPAAGADQRGSGSTRCVPPGVGRLAAGSHSTHSPSPLTSNFRKSAAASLSMFVVAAASGRFLCCDSGETWTDTGSCSYNQWFMDQTYVNNGECNFLTISVRICARRAR